MPATTSLGIHYLLPGDPPDLSGSEQTLTTDVDGLFQSRTVPLTVRQLARSTTASIPTATEGPINVWDLGSTVNVGNIAYSGGVFTVGTAGFYRWSASLVWPATSSATWARSLYVWKNGAATTNREGFGLQLLYGTGGGALIGDQNAGGELLLAVGDTLQLVCYHSFGSTLSVNPKVFTLARLA